MKEEQNIQLLQALVHWVTRSKSDPRIDKLWTDYAEILEKWDNIAKDIESKLFYMAPEIKQVLTCIMVYADTEHKAKFESLFPEVFGATQMPKPSDDLKTKHEQAVARLTEQADSINNGV